MAAELNMILITNASRPRLMPGKMYFACSSPPDEEEPEDRKQGQYGEHEHGSADHHRDAGHHQLKHVERVFKPVLRAGFQGQYIGGAVLEGNGICCIVFAYQRIFRCGIVDEYLLIGSEIEIGERQGD